MKLQLVKSLFSAFLLIAVGSAETNSLESVLRSASEMRKTGEYSNAEKLLSDAMGCIEVTTNELQKAVVYNNLALVKIYEGKFDDAEQLLKQTLEIRQQLCGTNNLLIANTLNNLGSLYGRTGKYSDAEPLFLQALDIRRNNLDEGDYKIAESLNNLAAVYHVQKKYTQAEKLFRKALAIIEKSNDKLNTAAELNNLGTVCFYQKKYSDAVKFHKRALKYREEFAGMYSPVTAESLYNISKTYNAVSNYFKAEKLCGRSLEIRGKILGVNHPEYAETLTLLANIYSSQNNKTKAEDFLKQSLEIKEKVLDKNHPDIIESLVDIAELYSSENKNDRAGNYYFKALNSLENAAKIAGGENYSTQYRKMQRDICGGFLYTLSKSQTNEYVKVENAFTAMEITRARLFLDELSSIAANKITGVSNLETKKMELLRKQINNANNEKKSEIETSRLKAELVKFEKKLEDKYSGYSELRNTKPADLNDFVENTLGKNEALINYWIDKNNLYAIVIHNGKTELISHKINLKNLFTEIAGLIDMLEDEAPCEEYKIRSYNLYKELLAPFIKNIDFNNTTTLFIVPNGILTAVPFEALTTTLNGEDFKHLDYFFEKTFIGYVPSATILKMIRDGIADEENMNYAKFPLLAFGDPIYTKEQAQIESKKDSTEYTLNLKVKDNLLALVTGDTTLNKKMTRSVSVSSNNETKLKPLPGSRQEVVVIDKIFYNTVTNNHIFLGGKAQESMIKKLNKKGELKKYHFIHFATHGFLPGEVDGLSEPCLVLSIYGKNENEDGFLKMSEILNMKINADLITLSACNSGVIEPEDFSEGISGLARSFFFAGAKSLLVTLWSIDDTATIKFMENYYSKLNEGMTASQALNFSRRKMLDSEFAHPGLWAPFVLNGEIKSIR